MKQWTLEETPLRVRNICTAIGRTQHQLSDFMGISPVTVSRWVNGKNIPDPRSRTILEKLEDRYVQEEN